MCLLKSRTTGAAFCVGKSVWLLLSKPNPPPSSSRTSLARSHILWICLLARSVAPPLREKTSLRFGFFAGAFAGEAEGAAHSMGFNIWG